MKYFKPDFALHHFSDITPKWLHRYGIKNIFSDLDSTLAIHDQLGDEEVIRWVDMLKQEEVTLVIISNNSQERVHRFCDPLQIKGFGRCNKPATGKIEEHIKSVGAKVETSLFLGDQLLTDVWCGKRLGMKTGLVTPVGIEHEPIQIRFKRQLESLIRKNW
ncbi:YqeG family HAD IIIA-type phosphatase [Bacillus alkalicellulosilyticus]|uniref:YqeG family HAD IIIA-type phosphatase n=1 Tax=Alkalihalobacterium alkalicellulosilyticum TaxID=1912214 RepID=UPI000997FB93|nr:YqeG family HAD IIIA-type phosphatase [Bacillus alkalicellulosilyticus]